MPPPSAFSIHNGSMDMSPAERDPPAAPPHHDLHDDLRGSGDGDEGDDRGGLRPVRDGRQRFSISGLCDGAAEDAVDAAPSSNAPALPCARSFSPTDLGAVDRGPGEGGASVEGARSALRWDRERSRREDRETIEALKNELVQLRLGMPKEDMANTGSSHSMVENSLHSIPESHITQTPRPPPQMSEVFECSEHTLQTCPLHIDALDVRMGSSRDLFQDVALGGHGSLHSVPAQQDGWVDTDALKTLQRENELLRRRLGLPSDVRIATHGHALAKSTRFRRLSSISSALTRQQSMTAARRARPRPDAEALAQSVADAGRNAFGCIFVEMWVLTDDGRKMTRPEGGHWMNPAFASSLPSEDLIEKAWELDRVAMDLPPGAGLVGILAEESGLGSGRVHWRQLKVLLEDPFVQHGAGRRIERLFELGIGLVASVPFSFIDARGLVLYYSRRMADPDLLQSPTNVRYLISSADLIGAGFSIRKSRDHSVKLRRKSYVASIKKVRKEMLSEATVSKLSSMSSMVFDPKSMERFRCQRAAEGVDPDGDGSDTPKDLIAVQIAKRAHNFSTRGLKRINNSRRKWGGSHLHGPPRQSLSASLFAFVGVFLTMLAILQLETRLEDTGGNFGFDGGWYTSTLCIVFALTPSPVGQPRQIVAAHLWNILVGLVCRLIPDRGFGFGMSLIWKQSLAVALGVSGQGCIGIMHPPATGLSFAFVTMPDWRWNTIALVVLIDVVVIVMSVVILNLSERHQYPLWWFGLGWPATGGTTRDYVHHIAQRARRRGDGRLPRGPRQSLKNPKILRRGSLFE